VFFAKKFISNLFFEFRMGRKIIVHIQLQHDGGSNATNTLFRMWMKIINYSASRGEVE